MHRPRDPNKTKTPTSPTVWRNFSLDPRLDLWVIRFCKANKIPRSAFFRRALEECLRRHDPDGEMPSGEMTEVLKERWMLAQNGEGRVTFQTSMPMLRVKEKLGIKR